MPLLRKLALLVSIALSACASAQSNFQGLGFLQQGYDSKVLGMSRNGQYVVGAMTGLGQSHGFLWTPSGGYKFLQYVTSAWDASDNGVVVGQTFQPNAFWYDSANNVYHAVAQLNIATSISADGSLFAGALLDPIISSHASMMDRNDNYVATLPTPQGLFGPTDVRMSADGSVLSGSYQGSQTIGFIWTATGGMHYITDPAYKGIYITGQSADGKVLVGWADTEFGPQAIRWRQSDGVQIISADWSVTSQAIGVSNDGNVIVGQQHYLRAFGLSESSGFIWTPSTGVRGLDSYLKPGITNTNNWHFDSLVAVSSDATKIAGYGTDPSGNVQGFYVTITPPKRLDYPGVSSLTLQPSPRVGGNSVSCRVDLGYPTNKTTAVSFRSLNNELIPPPSGALNGAAGVLIPSGATTAYSSMLTHGVAQQTVVRLISYDRYLLRYASMTLLPADLHIPKLSSSVVKGGTSTQLALPLNGEAPVDGCTVKLKTSDPSVQVPSTASYGSYGRSTTVTVSTSAVTSVKHVTITATYRGRTQSTMLTVNP